MNEELSKFEQERENQLSQLKKRQNDELAKFCADNNFMPPELNQQSSNFKTPTSLLKSFNLNHQLSSNFTPSSSSIILNSKSLNQFQINNKNSKLIKEDDIATNSQCSSTKESPITNSSTNENFLIKKFTQL